jgi:hypothetical protein
MVVMILSFYLDLVMTIYLLLICVTALEQTNNIALVTDGACNGTSADFTVSFETTEPGTYEVVSSDGSVVYGELVVSTVTCGTAHNITGVIPPTISGGTVDVKVRDKNDNSIETSTVTINIPGSCSLGGSCTNSTGNPTTLLNEDFGTTCGIPIGWTDDGADAFVYSAPNYSAINDHTTGSGCFAAHDDSSEDGDGGLKTPSIDMSAYTSVTLKFWYVNNAQSTSSQSNLRIDVSTNGGTSFTPDVGSYSSSYTTWTELTLDITSYISNQTVIRFRTIESNSFYSDVSIDDVLVTGYTAGSGENVSLTSVGTTRGYPQCTDGDWTYYAVDGSSPYIFAINWLPDGSLSTNNQDARDKSYVDVVVDANYGSKYSTVAGYAQYTTKRYVNVNFTEAVTMDENVNVRFFYDLTDTTEIVNAASTFASTNNVSNESFYWFKTTSGDFDPLTGLTTTEVSNSTQLTVASSSTENSVEYVQFNSIPSFSGFGGTDGAGPSVLPIELLEFGGKNHENYNLITWITATEINSDYFVIERSTDGRVFEELERVSAAGNSNTMLEYNIIDENPENSYFYRLKNVDYDGTFGYSKIILIGKSSQSEIVKSDELEFFPNPNKIGNLNIILESNYNNENVDVILYDLTGRLILKNTITLNKDLNLLNIDISEVPPSTYIISVMDKFSVKSARLIVTNSK